VSIFSNRARERLVKEARKRGLRIKQSYERVGPQLLMMSARYAHARQPKQAAACTRKLRTKLGRIIRQIERQKHDPKGNLAKLLMVAKKSMPRKESAFFRIDWVICGLRQG
jgi:IS5 family transposase